MERLGFILGILGVALALIAFDPDRVMDAKGLLFYGGVGLLALCSLMLLWPLIIILRRLITERDAPIYLGLFYNVLVRMGLPDSSEGRAAFVAALLHMVADGEVILMGRLQSDQLEIIPPSHFDEYSLISIPGTMTGLRVFKTGKGSYPLALLHCHGSYDRLHVPKNTIGSAQALLQAAQQLITIDTTPREKPNEGEYQQ